MKRILIGGLAAALFAACGGDSSGGKHEENTGGTGGTPGTATSAADFYLESGATTVPTWRGSGTAPKLAIVWQVIPGDSFDFAEELTTVPVLDVSVLPTNISPPPPEYLMPSDDFTFMYSQALIIAVDDVDGDGYFEWDGNNVQPPDVAVGVAPGNMLFYVDLDPNSTEPPSVQPGFYLSRLEFCAFTEMLDVPLNTGIPMDPLPAGTGPVDYLNLCGGTGTGICTTDPWGDACATCDEAEVERALTQDCTLETTGLDACGVTYGCIDATGAWDTTCAWQSCEAEIEAIGACIGAHYEMTACY